MSDPRPLPLPSPSDRDRAEGHDPDLADVLAAQRDRAAFDVLYGRYLDRVYSYAFYQLGDHHEAEDVTERTFLSALAGLPRFEERALPEDGEGASTFRIWLFRIARNVVNERRRRWRRRPEAPLDLALAAPDPTDIEHAVVERESAMSAWRAVDRLSGDRRRAVILRFVHEMSTAEIAAILGRSEGAVRVLIHRGLRGVARDLRDRREGRA